MFAGIISDLLERITSAISSIVNLIVDFFTNLF